MPTHRMWESVAMSNRLGENAMSKDQACGIIGKNYAESGAISRRSVAFCLPDNAVDKMANTFYT